MLRLGYEDVLGAQTPLFDIFLNLAIDLADSRAPDLFLTKVGSRLNFLLLA